MIRVLLFLVLLAAAATGAVWLAERPGDVVVVWQGYRVETSLAAAAVAVVAMALAIMFVWSLVSTVVRLPGILGLANRNRRKEKGFTAVTRGMVAIGAGDAASARRHAAEAERLLGKAPLALLLKAQTAQVTEDRAGADAAFKTMIEDPETRVLGLRGLHIEARRRNDEEAALAYAQEAMRLSPGAAWASEAVLTEQCARGEWNAARNILDRRAALQAISKNDAKRMRAALLTAEALDRPESAQDEALALAKEALKLRPALVPAAALAGRLLARKGDLRKASKVLETAWKTGPHPDLASAYLDVRPGDSAKDRLARARTLHKLVPDSAESRLVMLHAALDAGDLALAKRMRDELMVGEPTARVYLAGADLAEAEFGAGGEVREWLARAARAPRDPAWCADGTVSTAWQPVSPVSGAIDAFVWRRPPETGPRIVPAELVLGEPEPEQRPVALPSSLPRPAQDVTDAQDIADEQEATIEQEPATQIPARAPEPKRPLTAPESHIWGTPDYAPEPKAQTSAAPEAPGGLAAGLAPANDGGPPPNAPGSAGKPMQAGMETAAATGAPRTNGNGQGSNGPGTNGQRSGGQSSSGQSSGGQAPAGTAGTIAAGPAGTQDARFPLPPPPDVPGTDAGEEPDEDAARRRFPRLR